MKRKNLIVKRKVKNKKITIKNLQIKKFYKKFREITFKNIKNQPFALGVSGGADSMCLAYFSNIYASEFNNKVHTLIVNHNLRKESFKESKKVKAILKKKGIESKILHWKKKVPKKNIQGNARNMRYSLISDYCIKKKVKYLITGHHLDDQVENFFIRLTRGSGLTGLSSMSESVNLNKNLKIIRPFLSLKKINLKYVTENYFKTYILDPSNENENFLRIRIRKHRKAMEKEGLSTDKIIKTINNLLSANKALNFYKNKALEKHTSFISKNKCVLNERIFYEESGEIIFKSFSDILSLVAGKYYPPRSKKITSLMDRIKKGKFVKSTLGGCIIEKKGGFVLISKELNVKKMTHQMQK